MAKKSTGEIPDSQLTLAEIPGDSATWDQIASFARTFNAYTHWGSFEKCAEIANARRRETITELRTCLFFEQRRWNHFGCAPEADAMAYIRELIALIRSEVAAR